MKWLVVTTNPEPFLPGTEHPHGAGWNIGDQFARIGTEQVIRAVDRDATIELLNMDSAESILTERPFDRAVFAGRPMFWKGCITHPLWSELLNGWLCRDPRKVLALGVGDCFALPTPTSELVHLIRLAERRLFALTVRRTGNGEMEKFNGVCPAAWILYGRREEERRHLCNFMAGGAHYPEFNQNAADKWNRRAKDLAVGLMAFGFEFVAHTHAEAMLARDLGFPPERIHFGTTLSFYLGIYSQARIYAGNRVHGGIVLASRHASATVIGVDSRIYAAERCGMLAVNLGETEAFTLHNEDLDTMKRRIDFIRSEKEKAIQLMLHFAYDASP